MHDSLIVIACLQYANIICFMKVEDVPQDLKYFKGTVVRDVDYAIDNEGKYQMVRSDGWAPKTEALDLA